MPEQEDKIPVRDYVDRIFEEKDKQADYARTQLETALKEAKTTAQDAMSSAKEAADRENTVMRDRLDKLESGGAPFASRLDEGLAVLKTDVDQLKTEAVKSSALVAMRNANTAAIDQQRKQMRLIAFAAVLNFLLAIAGLFFLK